MKNLHQKLLTILAFFASISINCLSMTEPEIKSKSCRYFTASNNYGHNFRYRALLGKPDSFDPICLEFIQDYDTGKLLKLFGTPQGRIYITDCDLMDPLTEGPICFSGNISGCCATQDNSRVAFWSGNKLKIVDTYDHLSRWNLQQNNTRVMTPHGSEYIVHTNTNYTDLNIPCTISSAFFSPNNNDLFFILNDERAFGYLRSKDSYVSTRNLADQTPDIIDACFLSHKKIFLLLKNGSIAAIHVNELTNIKAVCNFYLVPSASETRNDLPPFRALSHIDESDCVVALSDHGIYHLWSAPDGSYHISKLPGSFALSDEPIKKFKMLTSTTFYLLQGDKLLYFNLK